VNSSALFFGNYVEMAIAVFFIGTVGLLIWLGIVTHLHIAFWISVAIAFAGWVWQYLRLKKADLPNAAYGEMFRQNVWIGFVLLTGMIGGSF
jgi:4-hydroxybenzoate polyprenyltransferase